MERNRFASRTFRFSVNSSGHDFQKFPRIFGCTLGEYARQVKIEKAISLIGQSRGSLADIAYECGFADQSHFIRAFKSATGFLPGEFKKI